MTDPDIVDSWFRLAEYRRRRFRRRRLAEFNLTTPRTNIPEDAPPLQMTQQGTSGTTGLNAEFTSKSLQPTGKTASHN